MTDDAPPLDDAPELEAAPEKRIIPGKNGGYRPNSGRKPKVGPGRPKKEAQADAYELLAKARAEHEVYKSRLAKLEYEQRAGTLVPKDEVASHWADEMRRARNHFLALPARVAPTVLALTEMRDVERALRDAVLEALDSYATTTD